MVEIEKFVVLLEKNRENTCWGKCRGRIQLLAKMLVVKMPGWENVGLRNAGEKLPVKKLSFEKDLSWEIVVWEIIGDS